MKMAKLLIKGSIGTWLTLSCTSRWHGRTFSSLRAYVHAFKLPHALHIGKPFSGSLGISNTHSNLGFGIPLLLHLILLGFLMLILRVVELIKKTLLVHVTFLDLLSIVCWSSHKQTYVTQSTIEAKYVAAASCCSQIVWIVHIMRDYIVAYKSVPFMCDSSSAICLAQNPVFHARAKHIEVRPLLERPYREGTYRVEIHWNREIVG
jgi:hypothetical protein